MNLAEYIMANSLSENRTTDIMSCSIHDLPCWQQLIRGDRCSIVDHLVAEGEGRLLYPDNAPRSDRFEPTNDKKKSNWSLQPLS
jgi:hypothetical protein